MEYPVIQQFRIWSAEENKFYFSGGTPMMLSSFFKQTATLHTVHKQPYQRDTFLKDENGKEIYEGDIVKLRNRNCKVYWADCGFALIREKDNQVWEWNGNLKGYCDGLWGGPPEIIGNVYENPELLDT